MAKKPANAGKSWTAAHDAQLRREAAQNTPTRVLGLHLGRTEDAVRSRAGELGVSLKPANQSPYGTRGKKR
ncbi:MULTISPECIES: hypothetical protein [Micrococcales]|jgi:hypothetical protein|uniref:Transcriptional regulator n=1 Tax=Kineosphaera limosa NBRC 100340 TaxID=1184609 RepID=K6VEL8_9MICO|nr:MULTISPECIES: hypothetical protein [Micrococcales]NYD99376.1 uncharacterized protein (DUF934 family) [Kineosphaera limosa]GAB94643.1 hypothetical protein KILIM_007_00820 [Kineosphaera limosa NBRC 100340]